MYLENYISVDLGNTTIQVLSGKIMVELIERKRNITLEIGDRIQVRLLMMMMIMASCIVPVSASAGHSFCIIGTFLFCVFVRIINV